MKAQVRRQGVTLGPPKKEKYLPTVSFRCPVDEHLWLEERRRASSSSMSETTVWALKLAHEYVRILEPLEERLEAIMRAEGATREDVVARLMKDALDRRRK